MQMINRVLYFPNPYYRMQTSNHFYLYDYLSNQRTNLNTLHPNKIRMDWISMECGNPPSWSTENEH